MKQPKFDIGDKVINIKNLSNKDYYWRYNNAPKGTLLEVKKIIIEEKEISYEVRNSRYSTFIVKEEELISEKEFLKQLKEKFKK